MLKKHLPNINFSLGNGGQLKYHVHTSTGLSHLLMLLYSECRNDKTMLKSIKCITFSWLATVVRALASALAALLTSSDAVGDRNRERTTCCFISLRQ